eukprot:7376576-Prymnesium_polylepis.1
MLEGKFPSMGLANPTTKLKRRFTGVMKTHLRHETDSFNLSCATKTPRRAVHRCPSARVASSRVADAVSRAESVVKSVGPTSDVPCAAVGVACVVGVGHGRAPRAVARGRGRRAGERRDGAHGGSRAAHFAFRISVRRT